jgi:hypothetical protein
MKLPNSDHSVVDNDKIDKYLLSDVHTDGKHKAAFFKRFGFSNGEPEIIVTSLKEHAIDRDVVGTEDNAQGKKYELVCEFKTPDFRNPCIRSIWIIKHNETFPRFVTAYPAT